MSQRPGPALMPPGHALPTGRPPREAWPKLEGYWWWWNRDRGMRWIKNPMALGWARLLHPFPHSDDLANRAIHGWLPLPASFPITKRPCQCNNTPRFWPQHRSPLDSIRMDTAYFCLCDFFFFNTTLGDQVLVSSNTLNQVTRKSCWTTDILPITNDHFIHSCAVSRAHFNPQLLLFSC